MSEEFIVALICTFIFDSVTYDTCIHMYSSEASDE
jgi:hypothetical protein